MPRPFKCRRVLGVPGTDYFKPRGIPLSDLQEIGLTIDQRRGNRWFRYRPK